MSADPTKFHSYFEPTTLSGRFIYFSLESILSECILQFLNQGATLRNLNGTQSYGVGRHGDDRVF